MGKLSSGFPSRFVKTQENVARPAVLAGDLNAELGSVTLDGLDGNWNVHENTGGTTRRGKKIDPRLRSCIFPFLGLQVLGLEIQDNSSTSFRKFSGGDKMHTLKSTGQLKRVAGAGPG